jgi:hypothetical protein
LRGTRRAAQLCVIKKTSVILRRPRATQPRGRWPPSGTPAPGTQTQKTRPARDDACVVECPNPA